MTYEEFKKDIEKLRNYIENTIDPCHKSNFIAEIIWLRAEYPEYSERLKMEEKDVC